MNKQNVLLFYIKLKVHLFRY